jgi:polyisoprenoid-binding protein YceI
VWVGGMIAAAILVAVVAPFVYIHFIRDPAPAPLTLSSVTSASSGASGTSGTSGAASSTPVDPQGTWVPTDASRAGYRVKEVLFGQSTTAVGRTNEISGSLTIAGTKVTAAEFTVDMRSVTSDSSQRDSQFNGRIMATSTYPTATFKLTSPIDLATIPDDKQQITVNATGELTLHGTTKPVTLQLQTQRSGSNILVNGSLDITFADWGIPNPSFGPASTEDHGVLEFLLVFTKQ